MNQMRQWRRNTFSKACAMSKRTNKNDTTQNSSTVNGTTSAIEGREWDVDWIPCDQLHPAKRNPRINDKTVPYLVNSFKRFGFKVPLVVGPNNVIVCGHTRYKAALKVGYAELPCVHADDLTDEELKAFQLADNKVQELSRWDTKALRDEILDLGAGFGDEMTDYGFGENDLVDPDDFFDDENAAGKQKKPHKVECQCPDCGYHWTEEV